MKPSQTGAARYGDGQASGQMRSAAPTRSSSRVSSIATRAVETGPASGASAGRAGVPARQTAISSAPSKIAGQIVANDQA